MRGAELEINITFSDHGRAMDFDGCEDTQSCICTTEDPHSDMYKKNICDDGSCSQSYGSFLDHPTQSLVSSNSSRIVVPRVSHSP